MVAIVKAEVVRARMTLEEVLMLRSLAGRDETMSDVLRDLVRREYRRKFGERRPERSAPPTIRGVIRDVTGSIHFTVGDIAARTGLPVRTIMGVLGELARWRLVERVDKQGAESTWESRLGGGAEHLEKEAEAAGFMLDASLHDATKIAWTPAAAPNYSPSDKSKEKGHE